jgi:hypothetical protein
MIQSWILEPKMTAECTQVADCKRAVGCTWVAGYTQAAATRRR